MREVLEMLRIPTEPTMEEKRQVLRILGTTVTLYSENDPSHDHLEIKHRSVKH